MLIGDRDKPQKTGPHTRFTSRRQASGNSSGRLTGQPFLAGLRSGSRSKLQPAADEEEAGPNGVAVCFAKCTIFLFATVTAALGLATLGLGVATFRSLSDLRAQCVNSAPWRPLGGATACCRVVDLQAALQASIDGEPVAGSRNNKVIEAALSRWPKTSDCMPCPPQRTYRVPKVANTALYEPAFLPIQDGDLVLLH